MYRGAYNGGRHAEACKVYEKMIEEDSTICLALIGIYNGEHILTSKYFGTILITIDPRG